MCSFHLFTPALSEKRKGHVLLAWRAEGWKGEFQFRFIEHWGVFFLLANLLALSYSFNISQQECTIQSNGFSIIEGELFCKFFLKYVRSGGRIGRSFQRLQSSQPMPKFFGPAASCYGPIRLANLDNGKVQCHDSGLVALILMFDRLLTKSLRLLMTDLYTNIPSF